MATKSVLQRSLSMQRMDTISGRTANFAWHVATPLLSRDPRTQVDVYRLRRAVSSS